MADDIERVHVNSLYDILRFPQPADIKATVGIVDDQWWAMEALTKGLVREGFRCIGFDIDELVRPSDMQQRELANQIAQTGLDVAIVDSGVGGVNGIELVGRLREQGLLTILFTGASPTSEAREAADRYVRKPVLARELGYVVSQLLGIEQTEE